MHESRLKLLETSIFGFWRPAVWAACLTDILPLGDLPVDDVPGQLLVHDGF